MSMLESIRAFFGAAHVTGASHAEPGATSGPDPLHVAACVLLLDIAYADGEFSAPERSHLEEVLERHFSLPPEAGRELIAYCESQRAKAVDHFQFTSVLQRAYDVGQKMVLAEIMWG